VDTETRRPTAPPQWRQTAERAVERTVLVTALALGVLVFFRRTRSLGRVLLALWLAVAWPLAWLWRALGSRPAAAEAVTRPLP